MENRTSLQGYLNALSQHVRARRKALGLTQEQLAERSGLSTNYVARLEIGSNTPSFPTLVALADALGSQVSDILAIRSDYTWLNEAQEIAQAIEPLDGRDIEYVLSQLQTTVSYIKAIKHERKSQQ